jgi:hypothetical protein
MTTNGLSLVRVLDAFTSIALDVWRCRGNGVSKGVYYVKTGITTPIDLGLYVRSSHNSHFRLYVSQVRYVDMSKVTLTLQSARPSATRRLPHPSFSLRAVLTHIVALPRR